MSDSMKVEQAQAFDTAVAREFVSHWKLLEEDGGETPEGPRFGLTLFMHGLQLVLESGEVGRQVFQAIRMARPGLVIATSTPIAPHFEHLLQEAMRSDDDG